MRSTGILFSAATIVVFIAHLCEGAAQKSGSLRAPTHHGGQFHHDVSEEVPVQHHSPSALIDDIPSGSKGDKHALKHALHLGKVRRQSHGSDKAGESAGKKSNTAAVIHIDSGNNVPAADVEDGQAKTVIHVQSADGFSAADGHSEENVEKDSTSSGSQAADDASDGNGVDSAFGDVSVDSSGDDVKDEPMVATDTEIDDEGDDASDEGSDAVPAGDDAVDASSYREAGAARVRQPAVAAPEPAPAADNSTIITVAPAATTTAATVTGLPGQLPGNDGEVIVTPEPAAEGADGARTEPGSDPGSMGMDNSTMKDPAVGNTTGVVDNSTGVIDNSSAGENNSTVVEDWGEEYGDAAQAHDDDVASGVPAGSSTATVSAGDGQGSGVTALIIGLIVILSLVAVALCLGTKL